MKERGQTLVEVLIGLVSMAIVISAITVVSISSLDNAQYSKNQSLATSYAQQGIELIRTIRNTDYATFSGLSGTYCLAKGCTTLNNSATSSINPCGRENASPPKCYPEQNADFFVRDVTITPSSLLCQSQWQVQVTVSWYDGKCAASTFCHHVDERSCLSNYLVPTP